MKKHLKMTRMFDEEEGQMIVWGEHEGFKTIREDISWQNRWSTYYDLIVQEKSTGNFYKYVIEKGSTEYQDVPSPDEYEFVQVWPKEKTVIVYEESQ